MSTEYRLSWEMPEPFRGECTCVPGEGCDQDGDPGCAYCQLAYPELPCPADTDDNEATWESQPSLRDIAILGGEPSL